MTAEYVKAIEPLDFTPILAAHGKAGSSWVVFRALSTFVARMLRQGVPPDDAACWATWDECLVDARQAGQGF